MSATYRASAGSLVSVAKSFICCPIDVSHVGDVRRHVSQGRVHLGFSALSVFALFVYVLHVNTTFHSRRTCEGTAVLQPASGPAPSCVRNLTRYSKYRCVGETVGDEPWKYRSCEYQNICYDGNSRGILTYFADSVDDVTHEVLSCGSMVPYPDDYRVSLTEIPVKVVRSATPAKASWPSLCRNVTTSTVTVLNNYLMPLIWSHLLMDNIFPIFRLLHMFGHHKKSVEPLYLGNPCQRSCGECIIPNTHTQWMDMLTKGQFSVQRLQDKYAWATDQAPVCFSTMVVGLSLFSDHGQGLSQHGRFLHRPDVALWGIGEHVSRFRRCTMKHFNAHDTHGVRMWDVVILRKGKSNFSGVRVDTTPMLTILRRMHANAKIQEVTLEDYSIKHQMEIMAQSKVVISEHGSTAYAALWLGKGATLILLHTTQDEKYDFYLWKNLHEIRVNYVLYNGTEASIREISKMVTCAIRRADTT